MESANSAPSSINTETTTETTSDINTPQPAVADKKKKEVVINYSQEFEEAFAIYPHRPGDGDEKDKQDTWCKWQKLIKSDLSATYETLLACAKNYTEECSFLHRDQEYHYKITNFYGKLAYYKKYLVKKPIKINEKNDEQQFSRKHSASEHHAAVCKFLREM